jgi:hypothetical protein
MRHLIAIAVVALSTAAHAGEHYIPPDSTYTWRAANGYTVSSRCHESYYTGTSCSTSSSGSILGDNSVPAAPVDLTPNTNPEWGKGCRSCENGGSK